MGESLLQYLDKPTMVEPMDAIFEVREDLIVSPMADADTKPNLRTAHFLKPSVAAIDESVPELPSLPTFKPQNWPLKVSFKGWRKPSRNWKSWVDNLRSKHQSVWEKAGIFEAIMSSTHEIRKNNDLLMGLAEKWCPETNTFVFRWAEATITLEDVMILGGFSVLGSPVFGSVESEEMKEIEEKLGKARMEVGRSSARKACQSGWMTKFMGSGSEIEHEAFLCLWLARFVLQDSDKILRTTVFPIAIQLARGTPIALAPAVLASIYRDLSLLKAAIVASVESDNGEDYDAVFAVTIWAPFKLVQIWAWERFPGLQPRSNVIKCNSLKSAKWDRVKEVKVCDVRLALDSAGNSFVWRPYAVGDGWHFHKFYRETQDWIAVDHLGFDEELLSFAICLRASELVGLGCIEQYLPHRVSMQFGMDQGLPSDVVRFNETAKLAWNNYMRPLHVTKFYIPSRLFMPGVTIRYLEWRKQTVLSQQDVITQVARRRRRRSSRRLKGLPPASKGNLVDDNADVPPGFAPKCVKVKTENSDEEVKPTAADLHRIHDSFANGDRALEKMVSPAKPIKTVMHTKAVREGSSRAEEGASESKVDLPVFNAVSSNVNVGDSSASTIEIPGLGLEARIARLEREVAALKAERFDQSFGRKSPTK